MNGFSGGDQGLEKLDLLPKALSRPLVTLLWVLGMPEAPLHTYKLSEAECHAFSMIRNKPTPTKMLSTSSLQLSCETVNESWFSGRGGRGGLHDTGKPEGAVPGRETAGRRRPAR